MSRYRYSVSSRNRSPPESGNRSPAAGSDGTSTAPRIINAAAMVALAWASDGFTIASVFWYSRLAATLLLSDAADFRSSAPGGSYSESCEMCPNDLVAFARGGFQLFPLQYADSCVPARDQSCALERAQHDRHGGTVHAQLTARNSCFRGKSSPSTRSCVCRSQRQQRCLTSWRALHAVHCMICRRVACAYTPMTSRKGPRAAHMGVSSPQPERVRRASMRLEGRSCRRCEHSSGKQMGRSVSRKLAGAIEVYDRLHSLDWCYATRDVASASELSAADVLPRRA
jgi:hypothetical protein